jgi:putative addiction module antidote
MNKPLKLIPIGNSTGAVFPKDLLQELGVRQGDQLIVIRTPEGIELRAGDPEFEAEMEILRDVMRRRRSALRELAK